MPTAAKKTTATRRATATKQTAAKKATPAKKAVTPPPEPEEVTFGVADLVAYLNENHPRPKGKKPLTTRELRTLIRKMARDDSGRVDRVIVAGNRSRYNWSGLEDPEVQAIIEAYNGGELDADKAEKLQALKDRKAQQRAEKAAAEEVDEDDEELDEEDVEDLEDDEDEE